MAAERTGRTVRRAASSVSVFLAWQIPYYLRSLLIIMASLFDRSVVEAVAEFNINFARVVPVESTEGDAVIEFDAAVGDVDGVERGGDALAEIFAEGKIERGVWWQMVPR